MAVIAGDLTGTERSVLLVLMAQCAPVSNPELARLGPALDKPGRDKLNRLGLIESERTGNRYVHELTDRGWRMCRDLVDADPPPRAAGPAKALQTVLAGLGRYLQATDLSLADVFGAAAPLPSPSPPSPSPSPSPPSPSPSSSSSPPPPPPAAMPDRIRASYLALADRPGSWVSLTRLRAAVDGPRDEVDAALRVLHRSPGVSVMPQENQKTLTDEDRAAAIVIGDRPKHLIAIEA